MVSAAFPAKTLPEFIAYARANPGKINQGSPGNGTMQHLAGELFKSMAGVDFVRIPYRGAAQAITDLLAGQVQVSSSRCLHPSSTSNLDGCAPWR